MTQNKMNEILFIGDLNEYGRSFQRYTTLKNLGHNVIGFSFVRVPWRPSDSSNLIQRIFWKIGFPFDSTGVNKKIRKEVDKKHFDIIWIEKGVTIYPSTLKYIKKNIPGVILVSCSEDDMYARHNRSYYYVWGLKYYDVVFTTKTYNLDELKHIGARRTELFLDSFDENVHQPLTLTREEESRFSCDVGAIGAFEKERADSLLYLAEHGIRVVVWGSGWDEWIGRNQNLVIKNEFLFGIDYVKGICGTKINLNFLRKINRDEVTSRSVEIPACGGFMLGERTKRHLDFFEEGKEAEFFDSNEEMFKKIEFYLKNEIKRKEIASVGRERCLKSGYSTRAQLSQMLIKASSLK